MSQRDYAEVIPVEKENAPISIKHNKSIIFKSMITCARSARVRAGNTKAKFLTGRAGSAKKTVF